jgi:hypothetical protein
VGIPVLCSVFALCMLGMESALLKCNVIFKLFHFHTGLLVLGVIRFGVEYPMYLDVWC